MLAQAQIGEAADMSRRALAAEFFGTFMLMASVLAAFFYAFATPTGAAGITGGWLLQSAAR
jgi:glycerol uptake facilitator-like aquaporin